MYSARFVDYTRMERVLVVDDEKECRYALANALTAKGFRPEIAENGRAALSVLERHPSVDGIVFSDMRMPEIDGLARTGRKSGRNRSDNRTRLAHRSS
jgi:CheY-like chemotaxis protein